MKKLTASLQWLDANILKVLLIGFIYIIPLYPKLPLNFIEYTFIYIRAEDYYIALVCLVFFIQLIRRKVTFPRQMIIPIFLFWTAVVASYVVANFVLHSLPYQHLQVSTLHALRRFEYMAIFFVAASQIKSKQDLFFYLKNMMVALILVALYGIGQKLFGWCAFQTMNAAFAKGQCLVLSSDARISSTFAGHYDLAAYLTLIIPVALGIYIYYKKPYYLLPFIAALGAMVLTASRASYGSYLLSTVPFLLFRKKFKLLFIVLALTAAFTPLSGELTSRIKRTVQPTQIYVDPTTGDAVVPQDPKQLPPGTVDQVDVKDIKGNKTVGQTTGGQGGVAIDPKASKAAREKIREEIIRQARKDGILLTEDQINSQVNTVFQDLVPVKKYLPDISQSVRYFVSWPRAIAAFIYNPITGKGPFALGEATDGDYFRWLGEFGLFGTLTFIYIFIAMAIHIIKNKHKFSNDEQTILYAFLFGILGLLINALYIDVFEASKVAYHVWLLGGLFVATASLSKEEAAKEIAEVPSEPTEKATKHNSKKHSK